MDYLVFLASHQLGLGIHRLVFDDLDKKYTQARARSAARKAERNHFKAQLQDLRCCY